MSVQDPRGEYYTTSYDFDAEGRVVREERPQGSEDAPASAAVFEYVYDNAGNLLETVDLAVRLGRETYAEMAGGKTTA